MPAALRGRSRVGRESLLSPAGWQPLAQLRSLLGLATHDSTFPDVPSFMVYGSRTHSQKPYFPHPWDASR